MVKELSTKALLPTRDLLCSKTCYFHSQLILLFKHMAMSLVVQIVKGSYKICYKLSMRGEQASRALKAEISDVSFERWGGTDYWR